MAQADGAVYINTKIDTSGVESGARITEERLREMSDKAGESIRKMADSVKSAGTEGLSDGFQQESDQIKEILDDTEKSAKAKAASIAAIYRKQGMNQSDAMKKAWEQIERTTDSGSKEVKKDVDSIGDESEKTGKRIKTNIGGGISSLGPIIKKIAGLMASAFAVGKLIAFGKEAINLGSDLAEVQNVVDVTFGDLNGEINDFAKNAIKQFGLSETSAKQFASTMGAMLKSMGLSTREAADMGMSIAGLAGDLASFYNLDAEEAFYKIRSGISGETEPLKQLGINLSVANLEQFALTQGITKSYNAMTQQEQALLRYNYLLSVTSDAQGDFARTSNGWANQTRILSEQFNSLKATLGQGLINLLTPLLKQLNQLIAYLQEAGNAFLRFTQILTGAKATQQAASGVQKQAEAYEEVTEATEEAEKAQSNYLTGLDEIHKFTDDSAAVTPADTTPAGTSTPALTPAVDFTPVEQGATVFDMIADKIKEIIKQAGKLKNALKSGFSGDHFGELKESIKAAVENISSFAGELGKITANAGVRTLETLSNTVSSIAQSTSDWLSGTDFGPITASVETLATKFGDISEKISNGLKWAYDNVLLPLASWAIEEGVPAALDAISSAISLISKVGEKAGEWLKAIWDAFLGKLVDAALGVIADLFNTIADVLSDVANNETAVTVLTGVGVAILAIVAAIKAWNIVQAILNALLNANPLGLIVTGIAAVIAAIVLCITYWDEIKEAIQKVWDKIVSVFSGIGEWFSDKFKAAWRGIKDAFSGAGRFFSSVWSSIKSAFGNIAGWFKDKFSKAWQAVKDVFSKGGKIFIGIKDGILEGLKKIINGLITGINKVIEVPFNGINWALRKLKGISILGIEPFGWINELDIPQIPYLATGAVIPPNAPFTAVLGDQRNGNNLEAPEGLIRKIIREEMGGQQGFNGTIRVPVVLDGRTITEVVIDRAMLMRAQSGKNPFALA